MNHNFSKELKVAISLSKEAGELLVKHFRTTYRIVRKSHHEMVSKVDILSQNLIIEKLLNSFPNYGFISEEKLEYNNIEGLTWVIDPLDGTHNYIAGIPNFGISIALVDKNNYYLGVIYLPIQDKLYYAIKGNGAFCNEEKIFSNNNDDLTKSMVAYDNNFHINENVLNNLKLIANESFTVRVLGSAVNDLCLISSGRLDARIWNATKIVDIAAGLVILNEAGGKITDYDGNDVNIRSTEILASNGLVHDKILSIINKKV